VLTTKGAAEAVVAWAGEVLEIGTGSQAAHEYLEQATDALADAIYDDATLGGHLTGRQMASPTFTVDLSSPFIEYDDGTRGRAFFASMAVAEARDEPGF
jgi:hypothetical protein